VRVVLGWGERKGGVRHEGEERRLTWRLARDRHVEGRGELHKVGVTQRGIMR